MNQEKLCFINRSTPGGGKSHQTEELKKHFPGLGVCSADHKFETPEGYEFIPWLIPVAHQESQYKFFELVSTGHPVVVVDNTNCQQWEFKNYIQQASFFGYRVIIVDLLPETLEEALEMGVRNSHGVPMEAIEGMFNRLEPNPEGFEVIRPDKGLKKQAA